MCKRRILYIEDDTSILCSVQTLLEMRLPVAVDTCTSAGGAELLLNRYCYDLIIADIGLPVIDGIQILDKVLQRDPGQPVMLLSEYDSDETRAQAERIGVPITPKFSRTPAETFVTMVSGLVNQRPCPEPVNIERSPNLLTPIKLITDSESKTRIALQAMGCGVAGRCALHKECLRRTQVFAPAVIGSTKAASSSSRLLLLFLLIFPWFIG